MHTICVATTATKLSRSPPSPARRGILYDDICNTMSLCPLENDGTGNSTANNKMKAARAGVPRPPPLVGRNRGAMTSLQQPNAMCVYVYDPESTKTLLLGCEESWGCKSKKITNHSLSMGAERGGGKGGVGVARKTRRGAKSWLGPKTVPSLHGCTQSVCNGRGGGGEGFN
jgi:hypothetical protein